MLERKALSLFIRILEAIPVGSSAKLLLLFNILNLYFRGIELNFSIENNRSPIIFIVRPISSYVA